MFPLILGVVAFIAIMAAVGAGSRPSPSAEPRREGSLGASPPPPPPMTPTSATALADHEEIVRRPIPEGPTPPPAPVSTATITTGPTPPPPPGPPAPTTASLTITPPSGDSARARSLAPGLSRHITAAGPSYSHARVREFQRAAGLPDDGYYGPDTRDALRRFGVRNPPPAWGGPGVVLPTAEDVRRD